MRQYDEFDRVQPATGESETLEPGGYICKIISAKVEKAKEGKNYDELMKVAFDIDEGNFKGYYSRRFDRSKNYRSDAKWPGVYHQTIKQSDLRYFKGFITAIEESNPGYKWTWDESSLKGKIFGGIFGEEEYRGNDGKVRTITKLQWVRSVGKVREGSFTIPPIKRLQRSGGASSTIPGLPPVEAYATELLPMTDEDGLPF